MEDLDSCVDDRPGYGRGEGGGQEDRYADTVIQMAEQARGSDLDQEALRERKALEDYRKAMDEAADDIRAQMSAELAGQGSTSDPPSEAR
jgi:hypothetical protein